MRALQDFGALGDEGLLAGSEFFVQGNEVIEETLGEIFLRIEICGSAIDVLRSGIFGGEWHGGSSCDGDSSSSDYGIAKGVYAVRCLGRETSWGSILKS
jgi:hypothetical protein